VGNVLGPLVVAAAFSLGLTWRIVFFGLGGLALVLILGVLARPFPKPGVAAGQKDDPEEAAVRPGVLLANLKLALRQPQILRWLALLEFSDLMGDIFTGYAPLYFTDAVGVTPVQASLILTLLLGLGLASDLALIPLLERVSGRKMVRLSAGLTLLVYPAFLLAPWLPVKLALLALIPFTTMGWYQVLQGETFAAVPGRSGTVMALTSIAGLVTGFLAWVIGAFANAFGLPAAMWLLLLGPVVVALWTPKDK
jgi:FSR family fosmidomycin resistance protein-like MFS transporter